MKNKSVLISGASIAGPALAYWLNRYGFSVTIVERASRLRTGGQAVDFKGDTHRTVLQRMGLLDEVIRHQTGGLDIAIVDEHDRTLTVMPGEFTGGDVEIRRGDLARLLYQRTEQECEYIFGDSIASLTQTGAGVDVTFERGTPRTFDLVVGADGIHSNTRRLAFGPESQYVEFLNHYYALVDLPTDGERVMYNELGRMATVGGTNYPAYFVFASDEPGWEQWDVDRQKSVLQEVYRGGKWRLPELMAQIPDAGGFYMDSLSRVGMDRYSTGRVALLGDAAYGNTLAGFGTGLAVVGAYVLAGELAAADGDHEVAFAQYETDFRQYAEVAKQSSAGPFLAPGTKARMWMRNSTFKFRFALRMMLKVTDHFATNIELKDYHVRSDR